MVLFPDLLPDLRSGQLPPMRPAHLLVGRLDTLDGLLNKTPNTTRVFPGAGQRQDVLLIKKRAKDLVGGCHPGCGLGGGGVEVGVEVGCGRQVFEECPKVAPPVGAAHVAE